MVSTITQIELSFSPRTRALMGEWLAHHAFSIHREMYNDCTEQDLSIREFYEQGAIDRNLGSFFNMSDRVGPSDEKQEIYTAGLFLRHEIVGTAQRDKNRYDYKPIVPYDKVVQIFFRNLDPANYPISLYFAYAIYEKTESEEYPFDFDEGCLPLITEMIAEGFVRRKDRQYFWTTKIRPLFEYMGIWRPRKIVRNEKLERERFNNAVEKCLAEEGQIAAMKMALAHPDINMADQINDDNVDVFLGVMDFSNVGKGKHKIKRKTSRLRWYGDID